MQTAPDFSAVIFKGRCPRCGQGKLYKGLLKVVDTCAACGLSFAGHEQGDGPAYFGILIVGTLAGIGAAVTEVVFSPPFWLHALIWVPFIFGAAIFSLRVGKAALIAVQYRTRGGDFN